MPGRSDFALPDDATASGARLRRTGAWDAGPDDDPAESPDLGSLPVAGLTRQRMLVVAILCASAWLAIAFGRQVGDVTAASDRADSLDLANQRLAEEVAALDGELRLIQRQEYIVQEARAYRLGSPREVPFTLAYPAPSLRPDSPGSAGVRVGVSGAIRSPLESWLSLLFGPTP